MCRLSTLRQHLHDPVPVAWDEPFHAAWLAGAALPEPLRLATAQAAEMAAARPFIKDGELIVGNNALRSVVTGLPSPYRSGVFLDREFLDVLKRDRAEARSRLAALEAYWTPWLRDNEPFRPMTCHAAPAYDRLLSLGVDGMRRYVTAWRVANSAARPECATWYDGLLVTLGGISAYIEAHARAADEAMAQASSVVRREELTRISDGCHHVAHLPPRSFQEAVQLFYLLFTLCGHDSPGPVDRMLYPYLRRDLDRSALTLPAAQEIVDCLWLKFEEKEALGATLGGQLRDGSDASNTLSLLCVDAIKRLRLLSPRTALRWHRGLSPKLFDRACESVASGATFPTFVNDEAIILAMVERGVSLEDAREYTFVGCGQVYPHGRGHGNYEDIFFGAAKPLEYALNDGIDPMTGQRVGLATGAPDSFRTFDEFERAYRQQMDGFIGRRIADVNAHRERTKDRAFFFLRSLLTYSCVERGMDWHAGGADYSEGMIDLVGLTTVTDSLFAIKRAVFEEGIVSLPELVAVLNRNWEDAEPLRLRLLHGTPKFGNDIAEADTLLVEEMSRINAFIGSHRTCFGGPWGMDIIGWSGAVEYGLETGATPDGRRRGEPLADCAGPAQGRNTSGLMPTLHSMLKLPHSHVHGPLALSLRFPRHAFSGSDGPARLRALVETYFRLGGQQLQVSIASTEEMRAALLDPEHYRSLIVRVGGFSAYFTQLDRKFQLDMIARSELEL